MHTQEAPAITDTQTPAAPPAQTAAARTAQTPHAGNPSRRALLLGAAGVGALSLAACDKPAPGGSAAAPTLSLPAAPDDLVFLSASKLAQLVRDKRVSARQLVAAFYARIDAVNPKINAVVQFCRERAYQEADAADASLARGQLLGPLHGVPMTIKDSWDTAGVISTGGTQGRANFIPEHDATVVARLRAAGAILLGKTNTSEFTIGGIAGLGTTANLIYGMSKNPYDVTRSTLGSTGGGGAIVAAGGSPFDIGTDFGGSIRGPAHANGIAGIKPTTGRVPRTGHIVDYGGVFDAYQQGGPLARYVEDLVLLLPIIAGPDDKDALIAPMPWPDPAKVDVKSLRVAWYTDFGADDKGEAAKPTPEMIATVQSCVKHLQSLGCQVSEARPPELLAINDISTRLREGDGNAWQKRLVEKYKTTVPGPARRFDYPLLKTEDYTELLEQRDAWRAKMIAWVKDYDLIVSPVQLGPAPVIGSREYEGKRGNSFTSTYNFTGWPSGVLRAGTSPEKMPLGVMFTAQPWREDVVLAAMAEIERRFGGWQKPAL
ncbi:amidase [Solimonas aquatica]|uniref:Amidase n=1 Tax=Solimonas aquatica TaxID=489703 RepID=A0A1H8ZUM5_9GAMM|nr:amidase [Solimonas aquatica]SEP68129.1 amidase [Solimonas aquatica]